MSITTTVTIDGIELYVEYRISEYRAATRYEPAEDAELEILCIMHRDEDIWSLLSDDIVKKIETKIIEDIAGSVDEDTPFYVERRINNFLWRMSRDR